MTAVTLYTQARVPPLRRGARGHPGAARRAAAVRAARGGHRAATTACMARYLERIPVVEVDGEVVSELELEPRRAAGQCSILSGDDQLAAIRDPMSDERRGRGHRSGPGPVGRRPPLAGGRGAAVALSPGPDPGSEDGQGDDLLPGARRVHAHQLDPDPPRPVGLRQVRQARRRLPRRLAGRADPQDPPQLRASTTSSCSGPGTWARRSPAPTSSPTTASRSSPSSTSSPKLVGKQLRRRRGARRRRPGAGGRGAGRGGRRAGRSLLGGPGRGRPAGRRRASRSSSTTPSSCSRCRRT